MTRLYALDTFSIVAMVWIFLNHCRYLCNSPILQNIWNSWLHYGGIGVEFFIILSGFMASYSYKPIKTSSYLKKKILRLYPVHWACIIIYLPLLFLFDYDVCHILISLLSTIFLLQTIYPDCCDLVNGASWTIGTLFVLYFSVPKTVEIIRKLNHKTILIISLALLFVYFIVCYLFFDTNIWLFYNTPYIRFLDFSFGVCIGEIVRRKCFKIHYNTVIEICSVVFFVVYFIIFHNTNHEGYFYIFPIILVILAFANNKGKLSNILSSKNLISASKYSFSFYLFHYPVVMYTKYCVDMLGIKGGLNLLLILFADFLIICIGSYILHNYIETPLID